MTSKRLWAAVTIIGAIILAVRFTTATVGTGATWIGATGYTMLLLGAAGLAWSSIISTRRGR